MCIRRYPDVRAYLNKFKASTGDALYNEKEKRMKENKKALSGAAKIAADKKAAKAQAQAEQATTNATATMTPNPEHQTTMQTAVTPKVSKELKIVFFPNSTRYCPWEAGLTTRQAMAKVGFQVKESSATETVTYTIRLNDSAMLALDTPIAEPNGSTVSMLMITEEIKGN